MFYLLFLLFIVVPIAELYVIIQVGQAIGALPTIAILVVDLSELAFADPSLMFDLAILAQRLRAGGRRLLVCGAQPHIVRLIELVGLNRQPGVQLAL